MLPVLKITRNKMIYFQLDQNDKNVIKCSDMIGLDGEMVDATDLKSVSRNGMSVRVRP